MIQENVQKILRELPVGVKLVAAAKARSPEEILEALDSGVEIIGENYIQEAELAFKVIGKKARWHFIGHLQKNKVKKAVSIFDMIETVDSFGLAEEIGKYSGKINKPMEVLIEINSGEELQKSGVFPKDAESIIRKAAGLKNIKVMGLMTMGPLKDDPEDIRPYFIKTREVFEKIRSLSIENVEMKYLSMGMSDSYKVAIEEGANMVRIGTRIFGERKI
ncbi:MAG: YggS family pyridoxal phosphate-dependent enzyme [Candidatus Omnitrophota bacterium]